MIPPSKYSIHIFIVHILKLSVGESLCSVEMQYVESKESGLDFESIQNVSASCPWVEAFINSFVFEAEIAVHIVCVGGCVPATQLPVVPGSTIVVT